MSRTKKALKGWLPFAVVGTAAVVLIYVGIQQDMRQTANDPQIRMAEDGAAALKNGSSTKSVIFPGSVDLSTSLDPFMIILNDAGEVLASSASLNGSTPTLPKGVLDTARTKGENRLTWQPQDGVRLATIVTYQDGKQPGFVVVGRSLREVEKREKQLAVMAAADLVGLLGASYIAVLLTL